MRFCLDLFIKFFPVLLMGICISSCSFLQEAPTPQEISSFKQLLNTDRNTIENARNHFNHIINFMQSRPDLFYEKNCDTNRMTTQVQRNEIRSTWLSFLDHVLALDSIGKQYSEFYRTLKNEEKKSAFRMAYAVFLMQYRYCLDFISLVERDACLDTTLNEPEVHLGIPKDTYLKLKGRFLNVLRGTEFLRLNMVYQYYRADPANPLTYGIKDDSRKLFMAGMGKGTYHTLKNALNIVERTAFTAWFPVQKGVSQWMGDTKIFRPKKVLIHPSQIEGVIPGLQPGDILLERREWYLSNIGLPGFWTHTALYIGTPKIRTRFFNDSQVKAWLKTFEGNYHSVDQLLKDKYANAYQRSTQPQNDSHRPSVIEAISEGVVFTTIQHSLAADSAVVLRPRLSKTAKARAILRAFYYSGRPYDFNFDFLTDSELVCTELIYKSYEPVNDVEGLQLPMRSMLGRNLLPANDIAMLYAKEYQTPHHQFAFVCFLDGNEYLGRAVFATEEDFLTSWKRPKWQILFHNDHQE